MIRDNLERLRWRIRDVCQRIGRDPGSVTLVGVTKFADLEAINEALDAGLDDIGENKVQQAQAKFGALKRPVRRHMIGHLQTNKIKDALEIFDVIQSVDSLKLAKGLQQAALARRKPVEILIQVNTSGEAQKFGIQPAETVPFLREIESYDHLTVTGLMGIAPLTQDEERIRQCFRDLKELFRQIREAYTKHSRIDLKHLSMGMSHDFEIALEEGATIVRIGTAIFGDKT